MKNWLLLIAMIACVGSLQAADEVAQCKKCKLKDWGSENAKQPEYYDDYIKAQEQPKAEAADTNTQPKTNSKTEQQ